MLHTTPARSAPKSLGAMTPEPFQPTRQALSEADLAVRWAMSPKTLQRWRMEGRGPVYLKLGKRVNYPLKAVIAFENYVLHVSTSERTDDGVGAA